MYFWIAGIGLHMRSLEQFAFQAKNPSKSGLGANFSPRAAALAACHPRSRCSPRAESWHEECERPVSHQHRLSSRRIRAAEARSREPPT